MRIVIPTTGSRGDLQPYVALGLGLRAAGHKVRIASHADFGTFVRERGLDFSAIAASSRRLHASEAGGDMIHSGGSPLAFARHFARTRAPLLSDLMARCDVACADADLVLAVPTTFGVAYSVAEKRRVPLLPAYYLPMAISRTQPSALAPEAPAWLPGRGLYNLLSHFVVSGYLWGQMRSAFNRARQEALGLPPLPLSGPPLRVFRTAPTLNGYSPLVVPRPADVGANHAVTGYWFLNSAPGWQPPPRLLDFLASGPPPVCIGFGSMHSRDVGRITEMAAEALTHCRQRGILLTGWGGLNSAHRSDDVFVADALPHDWLFPRSAAVVHHGGAGTTAAALRAGVPSVVVPFMADQPFWGRRVHCLGVGPAPIPYRKLTAPRLAEALRQAVSCPEMGRRAAWLGARLREEDGVGRAIEAVHECMPVLERQWDGRPEPTCDNAFYRPSTRRVLRPEGAVQVG